MTKNKMNNHTHLLNEGVPLVLKEARKLVGAEMLPLFLRGGEDD